jgi:hypothetical protein
MISRRSACLTARRKKLAVDEVARGQEAFRQEANPDVDVHRELHPHLHPGAGATLDRVVDLESPSKGQRESLTGLLVRRIRDPEHRVASAVAARVLLDARTMDDELVGQRSVDLAAQPRICAAADRIVRALVPPRASGMMCSGVASSIGMSVSAYGQ